ncbi:CheW protein [Haloterrigena turkmenica DSM 5511]|uniref:CheW protein n=1 Tax=Haloterrigena turkmenica (strain ATCC 51198 / DSM 5511 / JCM 9101 / NCIMB 13204 / VKM B-1734 / 4k) TaxID=543526 RepID=D2RYF4_HALTV|nr:chemotaxis protein CheW [Haloterrigena turkmenica]ADB59855.1 CheW protein [Haloterrigena turkmenica DSM 5511]
MTPDLSEKLLGIDIDDADERRQRDGSETDEPQAELEQFVVFGVGDHRFAIPVTAVRTLAEVPDDFTRVPRAPPAIEGMVDLRGDITAVVDPGVHFPTVERETTAGRERLLVLDRPSDQQSAAVHVDEVIGVEAVPEDEIVDETTLEESRLAGDALDHPLVVALFETERKPAASGRAAAGSQRSASAVDADRGAGGSALSAMQGSISDGTGDADGTPFEPESAAAGATDDADERDTNRTADSGSPQEIVIEATPVVDVERLLLASGQRE